MRRLLPLVLCLGLAGVFVWVLPNSRTEPAKSPFDAVTPALRALHASGPSDVAVGRATTLLTRHFDAQPPSPAALRTAWASTEPAVRWGGWMMAAAYEPADEAYWRALGLALADTTGIQSAALNALGARPQPWPVAARARVLALVTAPEASIRAQSLGVLQSIVTEPALWPVFCGALSDDNPDCRRAAAQALAKVPYADYDAPRAIGLVRSALVGAATDETPGVRMYVAMALGRMATGATPALDTLLALLQDESALVQGHAATALGRIGPAALSALRVALTTVSDQQTAMVLWAIRQGGAAAVPHLRAICETDARMAVRVMAAAKLWELQQPYSSLASVLEAALASRDVNAQLHAARTLERIGSAASDAAPHIRRAIARGTQPPNKPLERALAAALTRVNS